MVDLAQEHHITLSYEATSTAQCIESLFMTIKSTIDKLVSEKDAFLQKLASCLTKDISALNTRILPQAEEIHVLHFLQNSDIPKISKLIN